MNRGTVPLGVDGRGSPNYPEERAGQLFRPRYECKVRVRRESDGQSSTSPFAVTSLTIRGRCSSRVRYSVSVSCQNW
jgi:hypothetical protein